MDLVSVVIPTLDGGALFRDVLFRLRNQRLDAPLEIVLMDSGSRDQTLSYAREFDCRVEPVTRGTFDHGLTRNAGIAACGGAVVVLMTQDALPAHDRVVSELARPFADPSVAGVFARQVPRPDADVLVARNVSQWVAGAAEAQTSQVTDRAAYERMTPAQRHRFCVFDNVCSAVRRAVWEQIPFRQNDFGEDLDWSKRALEAGWKIVFQPTAQVVHSHDRSAMYEYKRTYMCHRKLYSLFGMANIPHWRYVPRCIMGATLGDTRYLLAHEHRWRARLRLLGRIPALAVASVLGQYHGARDERRQRGRKLAGV